MTELQKESKKKPDSMIDLEAVWTPLVQGAVDCYPADVKKPDISAIVNENMKSAEEAAKGNDEFKENRIPPPFSKYAAEWRYENLMPKRGDVLIVTYPKSGTTWMIAIVSQLLYKGNEEMLKISSRINSPFYVYLEGALPSMHEIYQNLPLKNRIYATHMRPDGVNVDKFKQCGAKIIYLLRNPKDQVVSWYNFRLKMPFYDIGKLLELHPKDWSEFLEKHHTGQQWLYNREGEWYPHHILSWYPYRYEEHVKFVYYEDLKQNPFTNIKKLADFLDIKRSDEEIREIVEATSFRSMTKQMEGNPAQALLRKGEIGDWKNYFTVSQSEQFDQKFEHALKDTDISFNYE